MDFDANETKEFSSGDAEYVEKIEHLKKFIREKRYFNPLFTYMALTDYGDVFLINPEKRAFDLQLKLTAIRKQTMAEFNHKPSE